MHAEGKSQTVSTNRRKWSLEEREAIVRASLKKGMTVNAVAQLYGVNPSQIYDWREQARQAAQPTKATALVPVQVTDGVPGDAIEPRPSCSLVIEAERSRITITGRIDAVVVRTILECLAQ